MARFLLSPRWVVTHVVVLAIAVLFVNLGFWQLRRLDERRSSNALIETRLATPPAPLHVVLASIGEDAGALAYRRVWTMGRYLRAEEVLLTPRSDNNQPGHHVVTPLLTRDGVAVLVDRGWVPFTMDRPPVQQARPPSGQVRVEGMLVPTQDAARYGSRDPDSDRLTFLSTVDVDRLQPQVSHRLQPFSLLLQDQRPATAGALPRPPEPPDLSEGSHLSYAIQWFLFAAIGLIGYPLLIRRNMPGRDDEPATGRAAR